MAIDYTDLAAINDSLKLAYGEGITNQFVDEQITYNQFEKSNRKPAGKGYEFGLKQSRGQGVGSRGESQNLPDPLVPKYDAGRINAKYIYGSLRLTGPAIESGKGNMAAFVDTLSDQVDDIFQSVINDLNRQTWGDGYGKLATLSASSDVLSTTATWTVTVDNDLGVTYLEPGMLVDFFDSTGATFDQSAVASRIASINPFNRTLEMEANDSTYKANHPITAAQSYTVAAAAVASGSIMVKMGTRATGWTSSAVSYDLTGLEAIYDDGTNLATFENIAVSGNDFWKANVLGNSGVNRELSIDLMLQALDLTRIRSQKRVSTIRMGLGQRRKYANLLLPDVRFQPTELKGGYETLTFAGGDGAVNIIIDPKTQPNKVYFEPDGTIMKYELMPIGWLDRDQQMHLRSGFDEWDMHLALYTNLGVEQRNGLTVLKDLVEPNIWS